MSFRSRRMRLSITWGLLCLALIAATPRPTCHCADGGQRFYCAKVLAKLWHGRSAEVADVPACCEECAAHRQSEQQDQPLTPQVSELAGDPCELLFTTVQIRISKSADVRHSVEQHCLHCVIPDLATSLVRNATSDWSIHSIALTRSSPPLTSVLLI